jgi:hypothetical protein
MEEIIKVSKGSRIKSVLGIMVNLEKHVSLPDYFNIKGLKIKSILPSFTLRVDADRL